MHPANVLSAFHDWYTCTYTLYIYTQMCIHIYKEPNDDDDDDESFAVMVVVGGGGGDGDYYLPVHELSRECVQSNIVHDLVKYWRNTQLCSTSRCIHLCIMPNNPPEIARRLSTR